jgi:hypothetical protein
MGKELLNNAKTLLKSINEKTQLVKIAFMMKSEWTSYCEEE